MKVEQVKAFKSDDGCIWETEVEAIDQNIENCIVSLFEISREPSYNDIKLWIKQNKVKVKYILNNVNKLNLD